VSTDYSRPVRLALASTANAAGLERRLQQTTIVTTCHDRAHLPTLAVLLANLRRLPVHLHFLFDSRDGLTDADVEVLVASAADLDPDRPLHLGDPQASPTLRLHVGPTTYQADISAAPDGHGVRLRRHGQQFPARSAVGTGLGCVLTAAVLTAEAFKEIVDVHATRHRRHDVFDFNPVTLEMDGPDLPFSVIEQSALIGGGAIGTAIGLIFRESRIEGSLTVVDPEIFEPPNVMTYSLGSHQDAVACVHKTRLLERELPNMDIHPVEGTAQDFINQIDQGIAPMPHTVLGAVDSVQARHEITKIYAPLTLDGSTGGITGTTIGLAEAAPHGPCLRCYYPKLPDLTTPSAEQHVSDKTGLSIELLADGDHVLSPDDLEHLPLDGARMLAPHLGKPVCGLARTLGLIGSEDAYRPSAAFVSQQAAALVVGAMIARTNGRVDRLRDLEYDALFGPCGTMIDHRRPNSSCRCQTDSDIIARVLNHRLAPS
jgi:hypothetical protein